MEQEKETTGMRILMSVITMLFFIGLVVMVFTMSIQKVGEEHDDVQGVTNATVQALSGVTDWFPIIIVISAMVVLISLTVMIIYAIKRSKFIGTA